MADKKERPKLPAAITIGISNSAEDFQNKVLRPIIKMQSELLLAHVHSKFPVLNINFQSLDLLKQKAVLEKLFSKDQAFKREIIGMVIGHFSLAEYHSYQEISKELNRRITQIVHNRCLDFLLK